MANMNMDASFYSNPARDLEGTAANQHWSSPYTMRAAGGQSSDQLETAAMNIVRHLCMTTNRLMQVKQCVLRLQDILRQLGPGWHVAPFGSTASGLCTRFSDLDATCYREDCLDIEPTLGTLPAIEELKMKLLPLLELHPHFKLVEQIWSARVPILKLKFYGDTKNGGNGTVDVDLSCHNTEPLSNTKLLHAYGKLSPTVKSLVMVIKHWAKVEQVSGAVDRNLSSYSITLLVIYYLLVIPALSMPCLPTEAYCFPESMAQQPRPDMKWKSPHPLGTLIRGFFNFYAYEFNWGEEVVSVRVGRRLSVGDDAYCKLKGRFHARLHIEDPYLLGRNLNCALAQDKEFILRTKLTWTSQLLHQGRAPQSLYHLPPSGQTAKDEMSADQNKADQRDEMSTGQNRADQREVMGSHESRRILPAAKHNDKSKWFDAGSKLQEDEVAEHPQYKKDAEDIEGIPTSKAAPEPSELPIPITLFMDHQNTIKL